MTVEEALTEARSHNKSQSVQSIAARVLADEIQRFRWLRTATVVALLDALMAAERGHCVEVACRITNCLKELRRPSK